MARFTVILLCLATVAAGIRLSGFWPRAGGIALALFWVAMIVALMSIVNDSDKRSP